MSVIRFNSIKFPQSTYQVQSDHDYRANPGLHMYVTQYDNCGDGMTQHSSAYSVPLERTVDFLESLALHLESNIDDIEKCRWLLDNKADRDVIKFLKTVKYSEKEKRYYSEYFKHVKGEKARIKMEDREKYETVPNYADGTFESVWQIFREKNYHIYPLSMLIAYVQIRKYWYDLEGNFPSDPEFLGKFLDGADDYRAISRVHCLMYAVEMYQAHENFDCEVRNIKSTHGIEI